MHLRNRQTRAGACPSAAAKNASLRADAEWKYPEPQSGMDGPSATGAKASPSGIPDRIRSRARYLRAMIALFALATVLGGVPGCGVNRFPALDEQVKAAWSEVLNQYQRRADLIPNLVQTVKGYAHQEQQVLTQVVEARAKATQTQMQLPADILSNPQAFHQFEQNQAALGSALGRLLAITENYPNLKSNQNFLALQSQLEGTENRISVARRDYILAVQEYNTALRSYPGRWTAAWFYPELKVRETFTISQEAQQVPKVNF